MAEFNLRIKEAFRFSGLKQQQLADFLGVNKSVVSTWVGGRNTPDVEKMIKIAAFLKVNPAWLAGYDIPRDLSGEDLELLERFKRLNRSEKEIIEALLEKFVGPIALHSSTLSYNSDKNLKRA